MGVAEYVALGGMGVSVVGLLGGWMQVLHKQRTLAFNDWRVAVTARMDRTDNDIRNLQLQTQAFSSDLAKSYVQRGEFLSAMDGIATRLENAVAEGNRRFDRIFEHILTAPRGQ